MKKWNSKSILAGLLAAIMLVSTTAMAGCDTNPDQIIQGEKGDTGAQGEKGEKGDPGAQGEKGDKGDTGAQGEKGDKGDTGVQGEKGNKGDTGAQGEKGDKGEKGDPGEQGEKGDPGAQGVSVVNAYVDENLHLWIVLSNGTKIDAGYVGVPTVKDSEGLAYTLSKDGTGYLVTGMGTCTDVDIHIPSTHEGKPVVGIGDGAFENQLLLLGVTIPDSVTSIGNGAFSECAELRSITIPDSVTSIGDGAFGGCAGLRSIIIPDSVTDIGHYAFYECNGLTSITIGNGMANIGDDAFIYCRNLTSITIGSMASIGCEAFLGCTKLTGVYITDIANWCSISFDSQSNPLYFAHDLYLNGELVTSLIIPDGVTSIGDCTFYGCTGLTSITIPDSVTNIGHGAFSGCTGLTSITFRGTKAQWQAFGVSEDCVVHCTDGDIE